MGNRNNKNRDNPKDNILKESGLTYEDYASIDDGNRYELVRGQLELLSPAPSIPHQLISFEMQKNIARNCESDYIILYAPVDVILSPTEEVRQPDLVLVNRKRVDILSKKGVEGTPNLVVEILSSSSLKRDKIDKLKTYARYRIPEYWIVEPTSGILEEYIIQDEQYELFNIFQGDEIVHSPNIPCISFTMAEIMNSIPEIRD
ncbi:Uma2 family endonuclease [Virgibacillus ndiopensis]|uniref:Uma2 family endonuclease n=1 Tax=Virgibacillus ndiopensis TaxID=2004408 RepID=UPI000C08B7B4|nr:Uma2 family endonuclease [Virgibacillus ndiopensis]